MSTLSFYPLRVILSSTHYRFLLGNDFNCTAFTLVFYTHNVLSTCHPGAAYWQCSVTCRRSPLQRKGRRRQSGLGGGRWQRGGGEVAGAQVWGQIGSDRSPAPSARRLNNDGHGPPAAGPGGEERVCRYACLSA